MRVFNNGNTVVEVSVKTRKNSGQSSVGGAGRAKWDGILQSQDEATQQVRSLTKKVCYCRWQKWCTSQAEGSLRTPCQIWKAHEKPKMIVAALMSSHWFAYQAIQWFWYKTQTEKNELVARPFTNAASKSKGRHPLGAEEKEEWNFFILCPAHQK